MRVRAHPITKTRQVIRALAVLLLPLPPQRLVEELMRRRPLIRTPLRLPRRAVLVPFLVVGGERRAATGEMRVDEVLDDGPAVGVGELAAHDDVVVGVGFEAHEDFAPGEVAVVGACDFLFDFHGGGVDFGEGGEAGVGGGGGDAVGAVVGGWWGLGEFVGGG
ncbi:hypothetical protein V498_10007, partial [Pseudogymnoascus sp. VKM F-4517 (FW-2822)]